MRSARWKQMLLCYYAILGLCLNSCNVESPHPTIVNLSRIMSLKFPSHVNSIDEIYDIKLMRKIDANKKTRVQGEFPSMYHNVLNYGVIDIYPDDKQACSVFHGNLNYTTELPIDEARSVMTGNDNLCAVFLGHRSKDEFGLYEGDRYFRVIIIKKSNVVIQLHEYAPEPTGLQKVLDSLAQNIELHLMSIVKR